MRILTEVIDKIVKVAPDLAEDLSSVRSSAQHAAPEMMWYWWDQTADVLNNKAINHDKLEQIRSMFNGKLVVIYNK